MARRRRRREGQRDRGDVIVLGLILVLVGFVMVKPQGSTPGSTAARNIDVGVHGVYQTPGYQGMSNERRWKIIRISTSIVMLIGGLAVIGVAS